MAEKKVCAVVGVGPGNGLAFAKRFAEGGYDVALLARSEDKLNTYENEIEQATGFACDVTAPEEVRQAFAEIERRLGPVDTLLYNAGAGSWSRPEDTTVEGMEASWRTNVLGLLVAAQQVIGNMRDAGEGKIIVTGATAALRGKPQTTAFASAKAAQRSLAQSLARDLGPDGIHVAYVIVDGVVDLPRTREAMPDKADDFFLKPDDIAETVWNIAHQAKSAWTFETDLRPYGENW